MPSPDEPLTMTSSPSDPVAILQNAFRCAIASALGDAYREVDPLIKPSGKPEFGDFQANAAMGLAKKIGTNPRKLAEQIMQAADPLLEAIAEPLEVAGPGFINITLKSEALVKMLKGMDDESLGVITDSDPHPIVIDMCSVNVAKQMHVGHLRSTIIGDAMAHILERLGRTVIKQNHLGDWGLPIAMVLHHLRESGQNLDDLDLDDLNHAYRQAQLETKADVRGLAAALEMNAGPHRIVELEEQAAGAQKALEDSKALLVELQQGDPQLLADWHKLIDCTMRSVYESLALLDVTLGPEHNCGESFYRDRLPDVIDAFTRFGLAEEDHGALVVKFDDRDRPLIIRKSDGGFLYSTTDLAAVKYRAGELGADRVIYVVDARQRDHFRDVFDAAHLIGWDQTEDGAPVELNHIAFGSVLGPDKRPLKTRSGKNITLNSLLTEAIKRGTSEVRKRAADPAAPTHGLTREELGTIGKAVGIGAIKYADLSNDLARDYIFNFDRMIAFEGNTGPYLQYAHARVCSIFAKSGLALSDIEGADLILAEPAERQLTLLLLRYGSIITDVGRTLEPHRLCTYLYEMADTFSAFYQQCPVLKAPDDALRKSRLRLCDLVRRVIADGLGLLGIDAPRQM